MGKRRDLSAKLEPLIERSGIKGGPESIDRDLTALFAKYCMDGGRFHALEAARLVAARTLQYAADQESDFDGVDPQHAVPMPWWAVRVFWLVWSEFLDALKAGDQDRVRLGRNFEVERPARGQLSTYEESLQRDRDVAIALLIAAKLPSSKKEATIVEVAGETGASERKVRDVWSAYEDRIGFAARWLQSKRV